MKFVSTVSQQVVLSPVLNDLSAAREISSDLQVQSQSTELDCRPQEGEIPNLGTVFCRSVLGSVCAI